MSSVDTTKKMKISPYLQPEYIRLDLTETTKSAAMRAVAELIRNDPRISDFEAFYSELLAREKVQNTALGGEVAIPHARTDLASDIVIAAGCNFEGIDFGASDGLAVRCIVVIAVPRPKVTEYLRLVSALARLMRQPAFREGLANCTTPEQFIQMFKDAEEE